jgi:hypothetical protein
VTLGLRDLVTMMAHWKTIVDDEQDIGPRVDHPPMINEGLLLAGGSNVLAELSIFRSLKKSIALPELTQMLRARWDILERAFLHA